MIYFDNKWRHYWKLMKDVQYKLISCHNTGHKNNVENCNVSLIIYHLYFYIIWCNGFCCDVTSVVFTIAALLFQAISCICVLTVSLFTAFFNCHSSFLYSVSVAYLLFALCFVLLLFCVFVLAVHLLSQCLYLSYLYYRCFSC